MSTPLPSDELNKIIEDVTLGNISQEDAARRLDILETEPGQYYCNSCRFFKVDECHEPGQPPRPENPLSVRCGNYVFDDPRDHALPPAPRAGSRMFK